ncbi:MAG: ABC transporter permease, partial [Tepidiformaceae bacterium]
MLRPFWIKTKADIRSRPWPTALLLLVVASTAALPTVALSVNRITDDAYQRTLDEANGAHVWLFSDDPALLEEATRTRGVTESSGPFLRAGGSYASIEGSFDLNLWGMPDERPVVGTTNVIEGRWLAPGAADEIVIDAGFADRANLHVGDVMQVAGDGESASLRVVGLGVNTTNAPFGVEQGQVDVFVAAPVAEQFASGEHGDYAAGVRLEDPGQAGSFARQFANSQGAAPGSVNSEPGVNIGFRTYKDIQAEVAGGQQTTLIFLGAFTAFAILAAGLILANTVASQVLSQQRDIGLLKAVGMTPGSVTRLLVVQYLFVGLLAGVVGIGAGALVAPVLVGRGARLLHTTAEPVFDPVASVAVLVGVLLIVLVFSLVPALRAGRTSTLSAIAPPLHGVGRASLARVAGRLRLPLPVTVALKDAFARPARSWLTI